MNTTILIIITLVISAFFSGIEIAFISSNKLKMELDKGKGLLNARIMSSFYRDPSRLIGTLLLGTTLPLSFMESRWLMCLNLLSFHGFPNN